MTPKSLSKNRLVPRPQFADGRLHRPYWGEPEAWPPSALRLHKNENPDPEMAAILKRLATEMPAEVLRSYPNVPALYRKLADNLGVSVDNLLLTNGSDGAIRSLFETFISPGDAVVMTRPTFAMFEVYRDIYGARGVTIEYESGPNGPVLDVERFVDAVRRERPRLVCLSNPASPTGTTLSDGDILSIIRAGADTGAAVLVDEAYYPFTEQTVLPWISDHLNLVVARTFAKAWAASGLRVGFAAAHQETTKLLHLSRPMYEIGAVSTYMIGRLLDFEHQMRASVERLNAGKAFFSEQMKSLGFVTVDGGANFVHIGFGPLTDAVAEGLADLVVYRPAEQHPSLRGLCRFSAATTDQFRPIVDRIAVVSSASEDLSAG
jgi:histidinol-phosphate aminotransferase